MPAFLPPWNLTPGKGYEALCTEHGSLLKESFPTLGACKEAVRLHNRNHHPEAYPEGPSATEGGGGDA